MATELATAYVSLVPSFRGGQRSISNALGGAPDSAGRDAGQRFSSSFTNIAKKVILGAAIYKGVTTAASFAKEAVFGFNSQLQNSTIAFTTMLGSGQKAKVFLDQLQDFAKTTPFEFSSLVQNTQTMMGMGVAAKDVIPDLTALGDSVASVGGGADVLNNTISAFSQTMAKGTLDMGNMNQLLQGGIPSALKILAASYHVTTGEMVKMISAGKVQSSDALPRLVKGLEQGTSATAALGGMMDKQSTTFSGAMSNISDSVTQTVAGAFRPFFDLTTKGMMNFATLLGSPAVSKFGERVSAGLMQAIKAVSSFNLGSVLSRIEPIAQSVMDRILIPAFQTLRDVVPKVGQAARNLLDVVVPLFKSGFTPLGNAVKLVWPAVRALGTALVAVTGFMKAHKVLVGALVVTIGTAVAIWNAWKLAVAAWALVTRAATAVQVAFNAVMDANPIVLVVAAIAALAAGLVYAYQHSETFRDIVQATFSAIKTAALFLWNNVLHPIFEAWKVEFQLLSAVITAVWNRVIKPIWQLTGSFLQAAWTTTIRPVLDALGTAFRAVGTGLQWAYDHIVKPYFGFVSASASAAKKVIAPIISAISTVFKGIGAGLQWAYDHVIKPVFKVIMDTVTTILDSWDYIKSGGQGQGHLDSGITTFPGNPGNNASGTNNWRGGWSWVGEQGPELLNLPAGSKIRSNADSMAMAGNIDGARFVLDAGSLGMLTGHIVSTSKGVMANAARDVALRGGRGQ